ncbi:MAG: PKD domain-containing protein, partial [Candidatus Zixiibacteriota bacterium]
PDSAWLFPGFGEWLEFNDGLWITLDVEYTASGYYDVGLIYYFGAYCDTLEIPGMIKVSTMLVDFDGTPGTGIAPLSVSFADLSLGSPQSWKWYFGDGDSSMIENPDHTYYPPQTPDKGEKTYPSYQGDVLDKFAGKQWPVEIAKSPILDKLDYLTDKYLAPSAGESDPVCSTYYYHNGQPAYLWRTPDPWGDDFRNTRFTCETPGKLKEIQMLLYDSERYGHCTGEGMTIFVWNSRDGFPGEVIDSVDVACSDIIYYPNWFTVDVFDKDIIVAGDFHIGYTVKDTTIDTILIVSDNGEDHSAWDSYRTSEFWNGFWWPIAPSWQGDYSFMINAVICEVQGTTFDVSLIVNDGSFEDTLVRPAYISILDTLIVDFTASPTSGKAPLNVAFQSLCNIIPSSVTWHFGDGDSSHVLDPEHVYNEIGVYTVKLYAEIPGYSDSMIMTDLIAVSDINADFSADVRCGGVSLVVNFSDLSTGSNPISAYFWDFGDGFTSSQSEPSHQFDSSGIYDITLIVNDAYGADTLVKEAYIIAQDSVSADFIGIPTSGKAPLTVMFEPVLDGAADSYYWDFGDGSDSSNVRNPIHQYTTQGKYDVKLRVSLNLDACTHVDSLTREDYVVVSELDAAFTATPKAGIAPLTVQFTDMSPGLPDTWYWDFGDGETALEQNPLHQFDTSGIYNVFLRVSNWLGDTDSLLKIEYIHAGDSPYVDLNIDIQGTNARPGFDVPFYYMWTNDETFTAQSCTLSILPPDRYAVFDVRPGDTIKTGTFNGYFFRGDTIIIPVGSIEPTDWYGGMVIVEGTLSEFVQIGDTISTEAWISTSSQEMNLDNNHNVLEMEVTGSIDPNDKLCFPAGIGEDKVVEPGKRLNYMIQFENKPEATAEATFIRIVDTLDTDLDWGTLAIGSMSHPDPCDCTFDPYKGIITWICDYIMLPPNINPPEGEGYVTYTISPKADLASGTEIRNTAWIRFDYNAWLQAPEDGPVIRTIGVSYICGDANMSGSVNLLDVTYLISYLYRGGPAPVPYEAGDVDGRININILDVTYLITYLYRGGPPPKCQ